MKSKVVVSILVLMDVPLQAQARKEVIVPAKSFNPCFNGCTSSRRISKTNRRAIERFNPCFNGCTSSSESDEAFRARKG